MSWININNNSKWKEGVRFTWANGSTSEDLYAILSQLIRDRESIKTKYTHMTRLTQQQELTLLALLDMWHTVNNTRMPAIISNFDEIYEEIRTKPQVLNQLIDDLTNAAIFSQEASDELKKMLRWDFTITYTKNPYNLESLKQKNIDFTPFLEAVEQMDDDELDEYIIKYRFFLQRHSWILPDLLWALTKSKKWITVIKKLFKKNICSYWIDNEYHQYDIIEHAETLLRTEEWTRLLKWMDEEEMFNVHELTPKEQKILQTIRLRIEK